MATLSSILAWRIPWTEEPSKLQFIVSQRVRHNLAANTMKSRTLYLFAPGLSAEELMLLNGGIGEDS